MSWPIKESVDGMPLQLNDVLAQVLTCNNCGLSSDCRSPIPVQTSTHPRYIVLGEAPGQVEDRQGHPFVGPAGQFLRRALRKVGLRGADGAWMNTVSCFPRQRKTPTPAEMKACRINLFSQLEVCQCRPVLVCGSIALRSMLPHAEMTYAGGQPVQAHGKVLYPVYHPAYILRSRQALEGWERQLSIFAGLVNDATVTVQDVQMLTYHCMYCSRQKSDNHLTCEQHKKWLRQDQFKVIPTTPMNEPTLFPK